MKLTRLGMFIVYGLACILLWLVIRGWVFDMTRGLHRHFRTWSATEWLVLLAITLLLVWANSRRV